MAKRLRYNRIIILCLIVVLALVVIFSTMIILDKINYNIPELSTEGYVLVNVETGDQKLVIGTNCLAVEGHVSDDIVHSVDNALQRSKDIRPLTHDMAINILESYNIEILMVKISELRDNNFIGQLILKSGNKITNIDVRPSDGIALALRENAPIYMNETLLKEKGEKIC
jgi:bifunctional DNase/RNase